MLRLRPLSIAALFLASGCSREGSVRTRAAFDLDCPEEQVSVQTISSYDATFGARGGGKRATYIWRSSGGAILSSPVQEDGPPAGASASASPPAGAPAPEPASRP